MGVKVSNLVTAHIRLVGTRVFLFNHFTPEDLPLQRQERTGRAGNDPEEWRNKVLVDHQQGDRLYFLPTYLFGCLRDGAKFQPLRRGTYQSLVTSTLQIETERIYLDHHLPEPLLADPTQPVYLDVQTARNPVTRARNIRYRVAVARGWTAEADILWDKTIVSVDMMQAIAIDAGRLVGVGDGRAIGYGRFEVVAFQVRD
jgi:hypothetical protein